MQNKDIQKSYPYPSEEQIKALKISKEELEVLNAGRNQAFELFWTSLMAGPRMNEDGTLRPKETYADLANYFLLGKPICFLGIGNENFVKLEAGDLRDMMNKHVSKLVLSNNNKPIEVDPYIGNRAAKVTTNYKPELNAEYDNISSVKPKGGSLWNKIVKAFTGHSSARWAAYDAYQKKESVYKAQNEAREFRNKTRETDINDKKVTIPRDPLNKKTIDTTYTKAIAKMANNVSTNDLNNTSAFYADNFGKAFTAVKEKLGIETKKEEIENEEIKYEDDYIEPQKNEKNLEQEQLKAKIEAKQNLETSANNITSQINKISGLDTKKLATSFMIVTKHVNDSDSIKLDEESIADHLTNMYLAGKLLSLKGTFGAKADNNENPFGVICEDLKSKEHPVYNDIKAYFLKKEDGMSVAEKMGSNTSSFKSMLSIEGLKEYVKSVDTKTGNLVDRIAETNLDKASSYLKEAEHKEKTKSNLGM